MENLEDSARHATGVLDITLVSICVVILSGMPPSSSHVWASEHVWTVRYSIDNELCEYGTGILGTLRTPFGPRASPICWYSVILPKLPPHPSLRNVFFLWILNLDSTVPFPTCLNKRKPTGWVTWRVCSDQEGR